jgi:hypothetical protein
VSLATTSPSVTCGGFGKRLGAFATIHSCASYTDASAPPLSSNTLRDAIVPAPASIQ